MCRRIAVSSGREGLRESSEVIVFHALDLIRMCFEWNSHVQLTKASGYHPSNYSKMGKRPILPQAPSGLPLALVSAELTIPTFWSEVKGASNLCILAPKTREPGAPKLMPYEARRARVPPTAPL